MTTLSSALVLAALSAFCIWALLQADRPTPNARAWRWAFWCSSVVVLAVAYCGLDAWTNDLALKIADNIHGCCSEVTR